MTSKVMHDFPNQNTVMLYKKTPELPARAYAITVFGLLESKERRRSLVLLLWIDLIWWLIVKFLYGGKVFIYGNSQPRALDPIRYTSPGPVSQWAMAHIDD